MPLSIEHDPKHYNAKNGTISREKRCECCQHLSGTVDGQSYCRRFKKTCTSIVKCPVFGDNDPSIGFYTDNNAASNTAPQIPLKPFNLNLSFDGNFLTVDYCDGADMETATISSQKELEAVVLEHVQTALSPEEDDGKEE